MKVIYRENNNVGSCPLLIDGKEYEVEGTMDCEEEGLFYAVIDESKDSAWEGQPTPYPAAVFEQNSAAIPWL